MIQTEEQTANQKNMWGEVGRGFEAALKVVGPLSNALTPITESARVMLAESMFQKMPKTRALVSLFLYRNRGQMSQIPQAA